MTEDNGQVSQERYGIGEIYGKSISKMSAQERSNFLRKSRDHLRDTLDSEDRPVCPFKSSRGVESRCHKQGGVCSIIKYRKTECEVEQIGKPVTICPARFQEVKEDYDIFVEISKRVMSEDHPTIISEVPFLKTKSKDGKSSKAGRIDWVLTSPDFRESDDQKWVAIETQAVYFSGDKMIDDVEDSLTDTSCLRFPKGKRRPDFRSSGPKRLGPQLQSKAPRIGRWGRNIVILVDGHFWGKLYGLTETKDIDVDNDEVIWAVAEYDENMSIYLSEIYGATLTESMEALSGTDPMDKSEFIDSLKNSINLRGIMT